jgi:hypothetical protein
MRVSAAMARAIAAGSGLVVWSSSRSTIRNTRRAARHCTMAGACRYTGQAYRFQLKSNLS